MWQERCVGGDHSDDRAHFTVSLRRHPGVRGVARDLPPHRDAGNTQILARSTEVALYEDAHGIAAVLGRQDPRSGADTALVAKADHAGPAADRAFLDRSRMRGVERVEYVLGLHVKAVDVVEPAVPGLRDHRQRPPAAGVVRRSMVYPPGDDR